MTQRLRPNFDRLRIRKIVTEREALSPTIYCRHLHACLSRIEELEAENDELLEQLGRMDVPVDEE